MTLGLLRCKTIWLCFAISLWLDAGLAFSDGEASTRPHLWFPVGETLTYEMHWGMIPVGSTVVSSRWMEEEGKTRIAIRFVTRTNRFLDNFYKVDDDIESVIDPVSFLPIRLTKRLSEGSFRSEEVTTFDFKSLKAKWVSKLDDRTLEYDIAPDTRDIVSFMYIMRQRNYEPGDQATYIVAGDEGMTTIDIKVEKIEKIKSKYAGTVKTSRIKPVVQSDSLFARKVPHKVWVTRDGNRLMLKMTVSVPVAFVTMNLTDVSVSEDEPTETNDVTEASPAAEASDGSE